MGRETQERESGGVALYATCIPSGECLECPFRGRAVTYGPFKSRRRGVSIGINLFPGVKVCSFDCVYCFRGPTLVKRLEPTEDAYGITPSLLREALKVAYERTILVEGKVDAIDFSGSGEPTLHAKFPDLVDVALSFAKEHGLEHGVGVFTNSTTLWSTRVGQALKKVSYVEAKLDTVDQYKFSVINQPVEGLKVNSIVEWLRGFRREFSGVLAVQVMLLSYGGLSNYEEVDAEILSEALRLIEPDVVHLYTVYRKPRLSSVLRASEGSMIEFSEKLREAGFRVVVYTR